jgi:hypothetical protein
LVEPAALSIIDITFSISPLTWLPTSSIRSVSRVGDR